MFGEGLSMDVSRSTSLDGSSLSIPPYVSKTLEQFLSAPLDHLEVGSEVALYAHRTRSHSTKQH